VKTAPHHPAIMPLLALPGKPRGPVKLFGRSPHAETLLARMRRSCPRQVR
jgi:hypothetical protein